MRTGWFRRCMFFIPTGFVMQLIESAETRIEFVSIGAVLYFTSKKMAMLLPARKANEFLSVVYIALSHHGVAVRFFSQKLCQRQNVLQSV